VIISGEEQLAVAGQVIEIPPNAPHKVVALEDSVSVDLFAPVRENWAHGDDAYLRG
jgi:quercetin dioxygenase-like cupin family protein